MEYGDIVRLEVASNLVLSEEERSRFLASYPKTQKFVEIIKSEAARSGEDETDDRIVIPSSILRKDRSIESYRLEEICVTPGDIEQTGAFMVSPIKNLSGDKI